MRGNRLEGIGVGSGRISVKMNAASSRLDLLNQIEGHGGQARMRKGMGQARAKEGKKEGRVNRKVKCSHDSINRRQEPKKA